jgi:hypothetical protein
MMKLCPPGTVTCAAAPARQVSSIETVRSSAAATIAKGNPLGGAGSLATVLPLVVSSVIGARSH